MKRKISIFVLVLLCAMMLLSSMPTLAVEPYQTYTYSSTGFALHSPAAYRPVKQIDSAHMDLFIPFEAASDITVGPDNEVYLCDGKNNRIIVLNGVDYKQEFIIETFENDVGRPDSLSAPEGVFVNDDNIYVCDTRNYRIVVFDRDGNFERIIPKPESNLFGTDTPYMPVSMVVDQYGRLFVVSSSTIDGVIVMNNDGQFTGFIGAQKVSYSFIDMIWRKFQTDEQKESSAANVSTEFNNITIDEEGFIYVTSDNIDPVNQQAAILSKSPDHAPIKKLNSAGDEILKRNGFFAPGGEVDVQDFVRDKEIPSGPSTIVDVAIGQQGTWSIADAKRSKIFTYDANGSLLYAFGDTGVQLGNMQNIKAIAYQEDKLLILDDVADVFTVYDRTEYGDLLIQAIEQENNREYDKAIDTWLNVLANNNNFDAAYVGVGESYYRQGDYENAMKYLEAARNTESWSESWQEVRKDIIEQYIILVPIVAIALILIWSKIMRYAAKLNTKTQMRVGRKTYWQELMYAFHLVFHPFDGFWDLKHEKRGSIRGALTILGITILAFYYQSIGTGYMMNPMGIYSTIFTQVISIAMPLLLWVVANWCLTTLFDGEGSFKDITVATCYALSPMPLLLVLSTILSNVVTSEEVALVTMLVTIAFVWAGFLIFFGMMVTHGYSFGKNLLMCLCTIVGMGVIIFLGFLFSSLIGKMISFVSAIVEEVGYRL